MGLTTLATHATRPSGPRTGTAGATSPGQGRLPPARRGHLGRGQRLARQQSGSDRRNPRRGQPDGTGATDGRVFLPEQRLDLATAVAAYTAGSAHVNGLDDAGSLLPGNLADLVVLDRDLFTRPAQEIAEARVLRTYVGGTLVHAV